MITGMWGPGCCCACSVAALEEATTNDVSFPRLLLMMACWWVLPREPSAPVLQGPRGQARRPGAARAAGLPAPVLGQATAFKRDGSQVGVSCAFPLLLLGL